MIKVATDHGLKITTRPVWEMTKPLCVYGLKNIFGTLPQFVNTRIDQILMGMLLPAQYLGLYVVAVSWSGIGSVLTNSISTILFPRISSDTSLEQSRTRMLRVVRLTTVISLIWTIFHLLVTPFVIPLIFGSDFRAAVPAALILVLTAPIQQLDSVLSSGLRGIGKPGLVGWSQGIGVIVTTILLYFLLPTFKELGAAVASLTAYSASFLITTYMFMNHFDIKPGELFILTHKEVSYLISFIKQKP